VIALAVPIISVVVSLMHRAHIIKLPVEPLHHTLNYKGLSEKKIIALYWGLTLIICAAAIYFYHAI
jgi:phospho-N-acetylmuramoyl-pentapeptide-transferase